MEDVKDTLFASDNDEKYVDEVPDVSSSDKALDDAYDAPLRVEILGVDQVPERTLILRSFKKLQDQWIVKEIDCRDRQTRSVTRMQITSSALGLDFDSSVFLPSGLSQSVQIDPKLFNSTD